MPWKRNDPPDPLEARRRQLEEQQRQLKEQRQRLQDELHGAGASPIKPVEPPVWRMEEDSGPERIADPTPARKRHLARQRQRDMVLFFIFIIVLFIVLGIVVIVAYVHTAAPASAA
jgi:hypothetical protein